MRRTISAVVALAGLAGSCGDGRKPTTVSIKGRALDVTVFATEKDRHAAMGLMKAFADGRAYLFLWPRERFVKMEAAALDVVFLDKACRVVETGRLDEKGAEGLVPETEAAAALLLPSGEIKAMEIRKGDVAQISGAPEARDLPSMKIGGVEARVELALTDPEHRRGLMFRPRMSADDGMLFAYPGEGTHQFWMKNTLIPLDIAFFSADGTLVNVNETPMYPDPRNPPVNYATSNSDGPSRYILEMNLGWFRKKGLVDAEGRVKPGVRAEFPPEAPPGRFPD